MNLETPNMATESNYRVIVSDSTFVKYNSKEDKPVWISVLEGDVYHSLYGSLSLKTAELLYRELGDVLKAIESNKLK